MTDETATAEGATSDADRPAPEELVNPEASRPAPDSPTRWEHLRARMLGTPRRRRLAGWLVPLLITAFAGILRLWNLSHPDTLAFDETYYVKDAWSLWVQGFEGVWAKDTNPLFEAGDTSGLSERGSFIVHPPLGKWIIALGMGLLGPGSSFGWRLTTALVGTALVLVLYLLALLISRSITVAAIAAGLLAIDGLGIVMSRIGLLDGSLALFILLGTLFVILDRRRTIPVLELRDPRPPGWGRVLWRRPWLLAAGIALGAASAVKWSGLYALAGLGIYLVVTDALARRRAGVHFWPTDAVIRQGPVSFLLLVPIAFATYLASWTGWLVTEGGWGRQKADNALVALWEYHVAIYNFHIGLTKGHPYQSPAWEWLLLLRPTAVWVGKDLESDCWWTDHCIAVISTIPNPLIWWGGVAASGFLLFLFVRGLVTRRPVPWALTIPLVGLGFTYAPWLLYPERTTYQFYTITMAPFVILALALALREIAGRRGDPLRRRQAGQRTVWIVLTVILVVSVLFYPVWTGMTVPYDFWRAHQWTPGWI